MLLSIVIRALGALSALVSTSLIISFLGVDTSGKYLTSVAYSLIVSVFISFGMNGVVVKYARRISNSKILKFITINISISFLPVLCIYFIVNFYFHFDVGDVILLMALFYSISQAFHLFLISRNKINISYSVFNILPNVTIVIGMLIEPKFMTEYYILSYFLASLIMFVFSAFSNKDCYEVSNQNMADFSERKEFFQQDLLGQAFTSVSTVLISINLDSASVAVFSIYQKLSSVSNIILSVMNQSSLSQGLDFISSNKLKELNVLSDSIFYKSIFILTGYFLVVVLTWDFIILTAFNLTGISLYPFILVSFSYYIVARSNIATYMLNSHGHEAYIRNISYITFVIGVVCLMVLPDFMGVEGGVISIGIMLASQSISTRLKFTRVFNEK